MAQNPFSIFWKGLFRHGQPRVWPYVGLLPLLAGIAAPIVHAQRPGPLMATAPDLASFRRPTTIPAPADNPINPAKVALGRALFFDPRLSDSGTIACATCHDPARGWEDGQAGSVGANGRRLSRRTPTILDVAWAEPLFWDGRASTLEEQARGPIESESEMNMPLHQLTEVVKRIPEYRSAFAAAFPGEPIDATAIFKALATFQRTIVSGVAPFDRWVNGEENAISAAARRGFTLFTTKAGCSSCHSGWRFTDDGFHDIGLPGSDLGRTRIMPGLPILERAFKTPTLRNVADRGPYMHDGSLATLDAVIDHYQHGFIERPSLSPEVKKLKLTRQDRKDLIAFIESLSGGNDTAILRFAQNRKSP